MTAIKRDTPEKVDSQRQAAPSLDSSLRIASTPELPGWSSVLTWMRNSVAALEHNQPIPRLKVPKTDSGGAPIDAAVRQEIKEYLAEFRADLKEILLATKPVNHDRRTERFFGDRLYPLEQYVEFNAEAAGNRRPGGITPGYHCLNLHGINPVEIFTTSGPGTRFAEVRQAVINLLEASLAETPEVTIKTDPHSASLVQRYIVAPLRADPETARLVDWMRIHYDHKVPSL